MSIPPPAERNAAARHTAWWTPLRLLAIAAMGWGGLAGVYFFLPWLLTKMWVFVLVLLVSAWLGAVTASVFAVFVLARRGSVLVAIGTAVVSAVLAIGVLVTDWVDVFAHVWFATHESQYTTAQQMARSGKLGSTAAWEYYGVELPPELRTLSVNGRMAAIGLAGGKPVLFIPAYIGIPDDGFGFAHLSGPPDWMLDAFGEPMQPRIDLGDGWCWLD